MLKHKIKVNLRSTAKKVSASSIIFSTFIGIGLGVFGNTSSLANTGIDFIWDTNSNYKKLKYRQSSTDRNDRATYFLLLRHIDRKTGIMKLSIKVPEYFDAEIKPKKVKLCQAKMGGYASKTRCIKNIPALIEINKEQTSIDIIPEKPIPADKETYALKMKIINPRKSGMFQFHAYAQAPGAMPISGYVGSWNIDVR